METKNNQNPKLSKAERRQKEQEERARSNELYTNDGLSHELNKLYSELKRDNPTQGKDWTWIQKMLSRRDEDYYGKVPRSKKQVQLIINIVRKYKPDSQYLKYYDSMSK